MLEIFAIYVVKFFIAVAVVLLLLFVFKEGPFEP